MKHIGFADTCDVVNTTLPVAASFSLRCQKRRLKSAATSKCVIFILAIFLCISSHAKNLGIWGAVFPIAEQDIKEFILEHVKHMQKTGVLEKLKQEFITRVEKHAVQPTPINLTTTNNPKTYYYDPTYTVTKNITDHKNNIIVKAGTMVNPLDTVKLRGVLLFFSAADKRQINWATKITRQYDNVRYVLTAGNIKEAGSILKSRIYFDQNGYLTKTLKIRHIPCMVKQHGKKLLIQEVSIRELS